MRSPQQWALIATAQHCIHTNLTDLSKDCAALGSTLHSYLLLLLRHYQPNGLTKVANMGLRPARAPPPTGDSFLRRSDLFCMLEYANVILHDCNGGIYSSDNTDSPVAVQDRPACTSRSFIATAMPLNLCSRPIAPSATGIAATIDRMENRLRRSRVPGGYGVHLRGAFSGAR